MRGILINNEGRSFYRLRQPKEAPMAIEFPDEIFGIKVEKRIIPRKGGKPFLFNSHTQIGVLH